MGQAVRPLERGPSLPRVQLPPRPQPTADARPEPSSEGSSTAGTMIFGLKSVCYTVLLW